MEQKTNKKVFVFKILTIRNKILVIGSHCVK